MEIKVLSKVENEIECGLPFEMHVAAYCPRHTKDMIEQNRLGRMVIAGGNRDCVSQYTAQSLAGLGTHWMNRGMSPWKHLR